MTSPVLLLAPIRGVTDCIFRTLFQQHFGGIDLAVAPFLHPQRFASLRDKHLADLLGCPAPMVAKKRRGSGLLPYPDAICSLLDTICPAIPQTLSIKPRLGYIAYSTESGS